MLLWYLTCKYTWWCFIGNSQVSSLQREQGHARGTRGYWKNAWRSGTWDVSYVNLICFFFLEVKDVSNSRLFMIMHYKLISLILPRKNTSFGVLLSLSYSLLAKLIANLVWQPRSFGFAGTKDKRSVSTQRVNLYFSLFYFSLT